MSFKKLIPKKKLEELNSEPENLNLEKYRVTREHPQSPKTKLTNKDLNQLIGELEKSRKKKNGKTHRAKMTPSEQAKMDTRKNGTTQKSLLTKNLVDQNSRARGERRLAEIIEHEPAVRKIIRKSAMLADLMTEEDLEADARVFREAKNACSRHYEPQIKDFAEYPDHKTRLAAAALSRAYVEGTPVQRSVILTHNFDSADKTIAKIKESPELLKAIQALQGVGLTLENGAGEAIDIESSEIFENQEVAPKTETEQSS